MAGGANGPGDRNLDDLASRWPHVRRAAEDALLQRARSGGSIVLVGEPGIGKTALASVLLAARRADGAHVVEVAGVAARRDLPLGALRRAVRPPNGLPVAQLLRWALQRLAEEAGDAPLVLGVDDGQHLDDVSAALVHQLVVTGRATAVVTVRQDEPVPDAIERLERDGFARRTTVAPLGTDEVGPLLQAALGAAATTSTVRALTAASGGNPMHLRELCAHGIDTGLLRRRAGSWTWDGPVRAGDSLRRLLVERIAGLDDAATRAVELLAFADVLSMGVCEAEVGTEVVDRLERRRLITVDRAGRREEVRLAHPLFGEVVRDGAPEGGRAIQAALADAVEAHGGRRGGDLGRIAEWRLAAGQQVDPAHLAAAATQAASTFDHVRAERLARAAVAGGGGAMATLTLGAVLVDVGRAAEAEQLWASIDLPRGDPLQVQIDLVRAENLFFGLDRAGAAAALLDDAAEQATTVGELEQIAIKRAMLQLYDGHPTSARTTVEDTARSDSPRRRRAGAVFHGPALAMEGRCTEALEVLDRALADVSDDDGSTHTTGELLAGRFLALVLGGRLSEAQSHAHAIRDLSAAIGSDEGVAVFGLAAGHAALLLGCVDEAIDSLEAAAALLHEQDRNRYLPWCLGELAHARTLAGDHDGAATALVEAVRTRAAAFRLFDCRLEIARARHAAATGRVPEARQLALAAARRAAGTGQLVFASQAFHDALRWGARMAHEVGPTSELRAIADATDSHLVGALAEHAAAVQRDDGGALHAVALELHALGARVHAAEALQLAADSHLRTGARARALGCSLAAREVAASCQGTATGWLGPLPALELLSARELEVAVRTAEGIPSRALAEQLYVSVRTVENHLHRAYAKLGVRGREELARAFAHPLDATEWRVAHDLEDAPSYVPAHAGPVEVEWLRTP